MAARAGNLDILRVLKEHGGKAKKTLLKRDKTQRNEAKTRGKGFTPLMYCIINNHVPCVRFLIFEVGWGEAPVDEVVALARSKAEKKDPDELEDELDKLRQLANTKSAFYKQQKEAHLKNLEKGKNGDDDERTEL